MFNDFPGKQWKTDVTMQCRAFSQVFVLDPSVSNIPHSDRVANKMAQLIRGLQEYYDRAMELQDPRVTHLPLMGSPLPMLAIVAAYVYFVRYLGPKLMQNRPPMEIRSVMIVYNIITVLVNFYLVQQSMALVWFGGGRYHIYKEPVDYSTDPAAVYIACTIWIFFMTKILDLLDTVFMVVRKKSDQLSFLHKYHHAFMVAGSWFGVSYIAGGSFIMVGTVNCFVHTVMYSYYLLTVIDPKYKQYIWCKRRLTELQMVQFLWLAIWACLFFCYSDSLLVKFTVCFFLPQNVFFFIMFFNFYKKTYLTKKTVKQN